MLPVAAHVPGVCAIVVVAKIPITTYIATAESIFLDITPPVKPDESNKNSAETVPTVGCPIS
jgi:hypothetical protein